MDEIQTAEIRSRFPVFRNKIYLNSYNTPEDITALLPGDRQEC